MEENIDSLKKKVEERKKLIVDIVGFGEELISERGQKLKDKEYSDHTHIEAQLNDFNGLTFWSEYGRTAWGGGSFKVMYRRNGRDELVLSLSYQNSLDECSVGTFDNNADWIMAFEDAKKRRQEIIKQIEDQKITTEKERQKVQENKIEEERIKKDAKRLGLI